MIDECTIIHNCAIKVFDRKLSELIEEILESLNTFIDIGDICNHLMIRACFEVYKECDEIVPCDSHNHEFERQLKQAIKIAKKMYGIHVRNTKGIQIQETSDV